MVITKLALPRRTFLRGVGATVALPFLDAMVPAMKAQSAREAPLDLRPSTVAMAPTWLEWTRHRRRRFRDVADPEGHRGVPRPDGRVHRTRQLPGNRPRRRWRVSTRAPRRPS